jgi:hypothetical protein
MKHTDFDDIDSFIDAVLKEERMQSVPFGFHRNVENNLKVAAKIQQERDQYRVLMFAGVTIYTMIFGTATLYMVLPAVIETAPSFFSFSSSFLRYLEGWWYQVVAFTGLLTTIGIWTLARLNREPTDLELAE